MELQLPLSGSGQVTINFGNCWGPGSVDLFLNGVKKCSAGPNILSKEVSMPFRHGDVLKIGEYNATILVLNNISISCQSQSEAATDCGQSQVQQPQARVTGSLSLRGGIGLSKSTVEISSQQALSSHFNVGIDQVTTTATESRRLDVDLRHLAGNWAIDYQLQILAFQISAIEETNAATVNDPAVFTSVLKSHLSAAGMSPSGADSFAVAAMSAVEVHTETTTTTATAMLEPAMLSATLPVVLPLWALALIAVFGSSANEYF